ncbi:MAG: histidinol-phosphate transaminase [Bdellovibrionales bacterium]
MQVSKEIMDLKPYVPGKPIEETKLEYGLSQVSKLASNENPMGVSPMVQEALVQRIGELNRYPDAGCVALKKAFSNYFDIGSEKITFGNGSNELIDLLIRIYCEKGDSILTTQSAFIAYQICAQAARVKVDHVDYDPVSLTVSAEDIISSYTTNHKIVFIANPNNPTGTFLERSEVEKIIHFFSTKKDVLLVFDEAYVEYARSEKYVSALKYLDQNSNLVVLRTMSKVYGIAGLRLGAVFADQEVVDFVDRVRNPFNINELAQVAGIAALQDQEYIRASQRMNWNGLDFFYRELNNLSLHYWPSETNFVLVRFERNVSSINQRLLEKGVIVRPVTNYGLHDCLRISVGTEEENRLAMKCLREVLNEVKK